MRRRSSGLSCLVAIDKPKGPSSHDVVARLRRALGESRVGHAGTLDPLASGVLVVGVGPATRLLGLLTLDDKSYEATISFGYETTTDDSEGEITRSVVPDASLFDAEVAQRLLASLVGEQQQIPPIYSAISSGGKRAYERARAGEQLNLAPRTIHIFEARLIALEVCDGAPVWHCHFRVSKGSYIRALARDIGRRVESAAHLSALVRTSSGPITLADCLTLEELDAEGRELAVRKALDPARVLGLPVRLLDERELAEVVQGRKIPAGLVLDLAEPSAGLRAPQSFEKVALIRKNSFYGVWECCAEMLRSTTNFPQGISGVRP